ncbi:MAG TPA: hypothetical protein VFQ11_12990 [Nocardioidaceae bacterium]|nr:hypothetical protein [Nocardioidaceae bacterium]
MTPHVATWVQVTVSRQRQVDRRQRRLRAVRLMEATADSPAAPPLVRPGRVSGSGAREL